jgi:hypothetical protein
MNSVRACVAVASVAVLLLASSVSRLPSQKAHTGLYLDIVCLGDEAAGESDEVEVGCVDRVVNGVPFKASCGVDAGYALVNADTQAVVEVPERVWLDTNNHLWLLFAAAPTVPFLVVRAPGTKGEQSWGTYEPGAQPEHLGCT